MHHIRDKKMWWVVNFCRPTVKVDPIGFSPVLGLAFIMAAMFVFTVLALGYDQLGATSLALIPFVAMPGVRFFNDAVTLFDDKIEDLQNELMDINQKMTNIQAKAKAENNRDLTPEESTAIDGCLARFDAVYQEIERRKKIANATASMSTSAGRRTPQQQPTQQIQAVPAFVNDKDKWGWKSFGEFSRAVKNAMRPGSGMTVDPRLVANQAPDTQGQTAPGEDGGFAVPPDFRREIMVKIAGEDSLLARTDGYTTESNAISFPTDETAPWAASGGVQAYWTAEAAKKTQSKVALKSFEVKLYKLAALIPMSDEILEDAAVMSTYLRRKAPEVIGFKVNQAIVVGQGDGSGQPTGILTSDARVTVERNTESPFTPVTFDDIVNMWGRLYRACRANAVWLVNQSIESSLMRMSFPGTGTVMPVYLPPGGLSQAPYGTLLGRPMIPTEACSEPGTEGDIILCDLRQYVTAQKVGGIRQDVSIHLFFDYDVTAFRFVLRVGGKPWWTAPVSALPGSENSPSTAETRSCYVTLSTVTP